MVSLFLVFDCWCLVNCIPCLGCLCGAVFGSDLLRGGYFALIVGLGCFVWVGFWVLAGSSGVMTMVCLLWLGLWVRVGLLGSCGFSWWLICFAVC